MAQLIVRNLDNAVKEALRNRAAAHGRSMEEEVRVLLGVALVRPAATTIPLGTRMAGRFKGSGIAAPITALRGKPIEPIKF